LQSKKSPVLASFSLRYPHFFLLDTSGGKESPQRKKGVSWHLKKNPFIKGMELKKKEKQGGRPFGKPYCPHRGKGNEMGGVWFGRRLVESVKRGGGRV